MWLFITARKRSLRRLCFHRCLSVHGGGSASMHAGIHPPGQVHPNWAGTPPGRYTHWGSACWDTVNKWAVHIQLECILVLITSNNVNRGNKRFIRAISWEARMHSSRMHTARSLTVSRSIQWGGGNCPLPLDADPPDADSPWMQTSLDPDKRVKTLPCPKLRLRAAKISANVHWCDV